MTQHIIPGTPPVTVILKRSGRARRISLRVSGIDGRVTLTLPSRVSEREALAFAYEKQDWLRGQLKRRPDAVHIAIGEAVPVAGRMREIVSGEGRQVVLRDDQIFVPGPEVRVAARLQGYLKELARNRLSEAVDHYSHQLGRKAGKLTIRDTRSRWGSCSSAGALMFSWRLIMAPADVLDYVAAHEVAHLAEMNHSPAFWATVQHIHGPYDAPRNWLRHQGQDLHRYRFS